jgi:hypothetical protein
MDCRRWNFYVIGVEPRGAVAHQDVQLEIYAADAAIESEQKVRAALGPTWLRTDAIARATRPKPVSLQLKQQRSCPTLGRAVDLWRAGADR